MWPVEKVMGHGEQDRWSYGPVKMKSWARCDSELVDCIGENCVDISGSVVLIGIVEERGYPDNGLHGVACHVM